MDEFLCNHLVSLGYRHRNRLDMNPDLVDSLPILNNREIVMATVDVFTFRNSIGWRVSAGKDAAHVS